MISDKYKLSFVHNPKCAGSSIKDALMKLPDAGWIKNDWHYTAEELFGFDSKINTDDHYSFAVCRNPFDRLVSAFTYNIEKVLDPGDYHWGAYPSSYKVLKTHVDEHLTGKNRWGGSDLITTFRAFVMSDDFDSLFHKGWPIHFKKQTHFITWGWVHDIFKFEELTGPFCGMKKVGHKIEQELILPYTNMSAHPDYREFYDINCMERVVRKYMQDFFEFGYHTHMLG